MEIYCFKFFLYTLFMAQFGFDEQAFQQRDQRGQSRFPRVFSLIRRISIL